MNLDDLAIKYDTDKSSKCHWYTRQYEQFFESKRFDIESVLELGVSSGASIRMWLDYFPNALVYGLDSNDVIGDYGPRAAFFRFDQANEEHLISSFRDARLELIIDDASHDQEKTLLSLKYLFPLLQPKGWYVIEDMDCNSFLGKFCQWSQPYRCEFKSLQIFLDKGEGSHIYFIQKK